MRLTSTIDHLRHAILNGDFTPGEWLREVQIAESLGVSRTPVRAALQKLATEGLLDHSPNRGYVVRGYSITEVINAYEIRAVLEGLAARLAAERGLTPEAETRLAQVMHQSDSLLASGLMGEDARHHYSRLNAAFHETILAAADSRMLSDMAALCSRVPISSPRNVVEFTGDDLRRRLDDHQRIYEAIIGREAWRAEMLMRDHVAGIRARLLRALRQPTQPDEETQEPLSPLQPREHGVSSAPDRL